MHRRDASVNVVASFVTDECNEQLTGDMSGFWELEECKRALLEFVKRGHKVS